MTARVERRGFKRATRPGPSTGTPPKPTDAAVYEVETVPGLEEFVEAELRSQLGHDLVSLVRSGAGRLTVGYAGLPQRLNRLQTAVAAYRVLRFAIPRPLALLGQQHFDRLIREIDQIRSRWPRDRFTSFRLSAAGADSAVFRRIKDAISQRTGLADSATEGDLAINVRRTAGENAGWDVLLRLSPRPLSARLWRVCNWPGALNATVARVMVGLARPSPSERFLNLACGSGTLLIERLADGPGGLAIGIDRDEAALDCARANLSAAAQTGAALIQADVRRLPLPDRSFDTLVADLPFGMRFGSTRENAELYPATLGEAARVAVPAATLVVITADIRSLRSAVDQTKTLWHLERDLPIALSYPSGYIHPHIVILRRNHLL